MLVSYCDQSDPFCAQHAQSNITQVSYPVDLRLPFSAHLKQNSDAFLHQFIPQFLHLFVAVILYIPYIWHHSPS